MIANLFRSLFYFQPMKSLRYIFGAFYFLFASVCSAQWTQEKSYPGGSTDAAVCFAIGDTLYLGGGSTGSTAFYKFDATTNTWTRKGDIPERAFGVSFSIGSKGYVALGQSDPQGAGQSSVSNDLWEYDPSTDNWAQKANFPGAARDAAFAFVLDGKAYVGGGTGALYNFYNDFYSYDPSTNTWSALHSLPDYLYFNSTFVIGSVGYVTTGANPNAELKSLWEYTPSSDSWKQLSDFPGKARESAVSFILNGMGYVGLGQSQYTTVFKDFYSYDPTQDVWSPVTSFPGDFGRGWAAAAATSSAAFVGLGTYFSGNNLIANNDIWKFSSSAGIVGSLAKVDENVFPNPAHQFVSLAGLPTSGARIEVRNALGSLYLRESISANGHIDVSSLAPGVYEVEIVSSVGHSSARIVKQ